MKILILGASHDQVAMIRKAKTLGHEAWVADKNSAAPGMIEATRAVAIDTSDVDALEQVARKGRIDGVCTIATNLAPRVVAELGKRLGLRAISPQGALNATDKARFRFLCEQEGIPVAEGGAARTFAEAERWVDALQGEAILKPSDSSGCRGIVVLEDRAALADSFARCVKESRSGEVVVERYHKDALVFGVESLVHDGRSHVIVVADKIVRRHPVISTAGVTVPSALTAAELSQLQETVQRLHEILRLPMGASHIDFVRDGNVLKVIDVGPRLAGGPLIHELAPRLSNVDMIRFVLEQAVGIETAPEPRPQNACGVERFLYAPYDGVLEDVQFPSLGDLMTMQWRIPRGSALRMHGTNVERMGYVTAIRSSRAEAEAAVRAFAEGVLLRIRDTSGHLRESHPLVFAES